jgi:hypothetical protein
MADSTASPATASTSSSTVSGSSVVASSAVVTASPTPLPQPLSRQLSVLLQPSNPVDADSSSGIHQGDCSGSPQTNSDLQEPTVPLPERVAALEVVIGQPAEPETRAAKEAQEAEKVETGRIPHEEALSADSAKVDPAAAEVAGLAGEHGAESAVMIEVQPSAVGIAENLTLASARLEEGAAVSAEGRGLATFGEDVADEGHVAKAGNEAVEAGGEHVSAAAGTEHSAERIAEIEPEPDLESEQSSNPRFPKELVVEETRAHQQADFLPAAHASSVAGGGDGPLVAAVEALFTLPAFDEAGLEQVAIGTIAAVPDMDSTAGSLLETAKREGMMDESGSHADQETVTAGTLRPTQRDTQGLSPSSASYKSASAKTAARGARATPRIPPLGRRAIIPPKRLIASISLMNRPSVSPIGSAISDEMPATRRAGFVTPNASVRQKLRHRAEILQPLPSPGLWRSDPAVQGAQRRAEEVLHRRIADGELRAAVDAPSTHQFAIAGYLPPCLSSLMLLLGRLLLITLSYCFQEPFTPSQYFYSIHARKLLHLS